MICSIFLALALVLSQETPRRDPADPRPGEVLAWTSKDGIPFEYRLPADFDAERGANLVLVLHGNGLDQRWTFWNHPPQEFRAADIVVSPDGTSAHAGTGANEFLDGADDVRRFRALLDELRGHWKVRQVFLYGHSQGSFFAFFYAGHHPDTIDGVVGHASGVWSHTPMGRDGHRLAIGLMHGTDDHIPYAQGWYGRQSYRDAGYPLVHLRTLFDWPHRPNWVQAQQMLAWCEGLTSTAPERVAAALETLSDPKAPMGLDPAALHAVAARLGELAGASEAQQRLRQRRARTVEELCAQLCTEVERGLGRGKLPAPAAEEWLGLAIRLVEEFDGVPALEAFLKGKGKSLVQARKNASAALAEYERKRERDPVPALAAALDLLESGWLSERCPEIVQAIAPTLAAGREHKLPRRTLERAAELSEAYAKGRERGFAAFTRALAGLEL